jgi:tetratricopeptide (TPR) repeat protein
MQEAAAAFRAALEVYTRARVPLQWAQMQNNLGTVLARLGAREGEVDQLKESVAAYRAALQELTRERMPLAWAETQNNLGRTLLDLGQRARRPADLEAALEAFKRSRDLFSTTEAPHADYFADKIAETEAALAELP